jgi:hypothetical protein
VFDGDADPRLEPKEQVLELGDPEDPVAVPLSVLADSRVLEVAGHLDTFWFAWAAFHPDTRLVVPPG